MAVILQDHRTNALELKELHQTNNVSQFQGVVWSELSEDLTDLPNSSHFTDQSLSLEVHVAGLLVILTASSISNGLALLVFYKKPLLRTSSNRFVLNLSVTHMLHSVLVLPFTVISVIHEGWIFGDIWCQGSGVMSLCLGLETAFSLVLISMDRNRAVNSPLQYTSSTTKRRTVYLIIGSWSLSVLLVLPTATGVSKIKFKPSWNHCVLSGPLGDSVNILYAALLTSTGFLLPFIKISSIYFSMLQAARANNARARKHSLGTIIPDAQIPDSSTKGSNPSVPKTKSCRRSSNTSQSSVFGDEWKAIRTGLLVSTSFLFCWGPYFIVLFVSSFVSEDNWMPPYFAELVSLMAVASAIIDPYIYVFRNKAVRKNVKRLFLCSSNASHLPSVRNRKPQQVPSTAVLKLTSGNTVEHIVVPSVGNSALPSKNKDVKNNSEIFSQSNQSYTGELFDNFVCYPPKDIPIINQKVLITETKGDENCTPHRSIRPAERVEKSLMFYLFTPSSSSL
ncbi:G-protein coupled receptor 161-like [Limulus polyphemus]|uniref:G-protein coupled receptor 161-like n=1 Tax=Limulus polyphemus TaxID=6850 RepID=A0ABM1THJ3_LIMPO|nr:G-protein coupled receptor 161-like [Limulus polyphemus]